MNYKQIGVAIVSILSLLGAIAFFEVNVTETHTLGSTGNGSETYYNSQWLVGGVQIGLTGTLDANRQFGTCNPTFYGTSLGATTTGTFVCPVQGINAGDFIHADLPLTEAGTGGGFDIVNAYATTSNTVAFTYLNLTGAATSSFKQATTAVEFWTDR